MVALRGLAAQELVLLNYGDLSNDLLLLDYGTTRTRTRTRTISP